MSALTLAAADADAPRILIVRLSALGDIVFASSVLDALRTRWPRARIDWLVQQNFAGILEHDPRLDQRVIVPADIYRSFKALRALRRELAQHRYDWVLDLQGLLKSRLLAALAPGATRVGFASREPGAFLMHRLLPKGGDARDISSEYRYFAEALTGHPAAAPRLPVISAVASAVEATAGELGLPEHYIALCPFTTRPQKHWFEEHWIALAQQLHAAGLGPCAVLGGPADREAAQRLVRAMPQGTLDLAGRTRLAELPVWLARARLVIGVDTGLTHIGIAVGRPVVALFGSTRPYVQGAQSPLAVLFEDLPCAPCKRRPTCNGAWTCMRQLEPARVSAAALRLLEQAR